MRLPLRLESRPNVVVPHCDLNLRRAGQFGSHLRPEGSINEIYNAEQGELLVLGEPGSGKTTLLLQIAERLLRNAEIDPNLPTPVFFNLAAWRKHIRLDEWLIQQLNKEYGIPKRTGKRWLERGELALLLDGLDEVASECRSDCVEAINTYHLNHQSVIHPMVVSCRTRDYDQISRLLLNAAVAIQPLTKEQVNDYLKTAGAALAGLRTVLRDDPNLYQDLFTTPLIINVAAITYEGRSGAELRRIAKAEERLKKLWDAYIDRMFERRQEEEAPKYETSVALNWLGWLGSYLSNKELRKYLIEEMQPCDLPTRSQAAIVRWLPVLLTYGLSISVVFVADFMRGYTDNIATGIKLFFLVLIHLLLWYRRRIQLQPLRSFSIRRLYDQRRAILHRIVKRAIFAAGGAGILGGALGVVFGILIGLTALFSGEGSRTARTFEAITTVPLTVLLFAVICGLQGLGIGIGVGVFKEVFAEGLIDNTVRPNEGIHRSLRTAVRTPVFGFLLGAVLGGALGLLSGLLVVVAFDKSAIIILVAGLVGAYMGTVLAMFLSLFVIMPLLGGRAALQHYFLRLLLWQSGNFPLNITDFLDWTTNRIITQRVGGGWQFVHRTLQERFAERYREAR
ncbi:MAG: NACHT domain-containing protein [Acidobacteriota bacterium]